ncbi:MAG: ORF6N domain-containing protein [Candidatus Marinimicrobia bacterium]|nr:ORF6N domain-containing protein [Candidatus Neomarinimicrobiota bacterium]
MPEHSAAEPEAKQDLPAPTKDIKNLIYSLRGRHVMLDRDIAALYGVKPIRLREQVHRNIDRFPEDFMFRLTKTEVDLMVSQNAIPSRQHLGGSLPFAFTEQGVASLSAVLRSEKAVETHIKIMRAFVDMRHFIEQNAMIFSRIYSLEERQKAFETETGANFEKVFNALGKASYIPKQGIFYRGQIFDAYVFISKLIRSANKSIVLIDNYIDESVLTLLDKRKKGVDACIYTKHISKNFTLDLKKHNRQYAPVKVEVFREAHDRFLIIDKKDIYHIGASLKDLGKSGPPFQNSKRIRSICYNNWGNE